MRVAVKPEMLRWACERAGYDTDSLTHRFPQLPAWERGEAEPTFRQVEDFAKATHTAIGFLFLPEPPVEKVPIPDFRTVELGAVEAPSPDLLDTIYLCQQRQEWYREFIHFGGEKTVSFVGSAGVTGDVERTAATIRAALRFDLDSRRKARTWTEALSQFIAQADEAGVLVMVSGVVGNNNRRKLDPDEFRGFALSDDLAPLVFINGADTKSAQMFTLAHELAHIWLGQSALSNDGPTSHPTHAVELWCNRVAAEILVPLAVFREEYQRTADLQEEMQRLAKCYKVSTLVILRRMHDAGGLTDDELWNAYRQELAHLRAIPKGSGGDFYLTQSARVSKRFARALVASTLEGHTLHRDAFRLLGFSKLATFRELGHSLGVV
jgi:Zn-dependent peptidase ImmA (M78 family)